ncbi:MAG TPA: phosphate signaling complex protein PhoU [Dongiaceae bacterium]|jgi:phosphate transport system protein|nr:phosphate signaling complex protein PhoU [Dongiaceae bacterium]
MPHIVKSFDDELKKLTHMIGAMGGLVESELRQALDALEHFDTERAKTVISDDVKVDRLEQEIAAFCVKILALRQPMAQDLREVVAAIKISSDIERIGDYAKNIAKRAMLLEQETSLRPLGGLLRMGRLALSITDEIIGAYVDKDQERALAGWRRDQEVDEMYASLFREMLTYMMEDPRNIGPCTHLLFIAKNIERIGDHATNIAEVLYFLVTGKNLEEERPRHDSTRMT